MKATNHSPSPDELVTAIDENRASFRFLLEHYFHPQTICSEPRDSCRRLDDTCRFLTRNFAREEWFMLESGYPELENHQREHAEILATLEGMRLDLTCNAYDNSAVCMLLTEWVERHDTERDEPFRKFLQHRTTGKA